CPNVICGGVGWKLYLSAGIDSAAVTRFFDALASELRNASLTGDVEGLNGGGPCTKRLSIGIIARGSGFIQPPNQCTSWVTSGDDSIRSLRWLELFVSRLPEHECKLAGKIAEGDDLLLREVTVVVVNFEHHRLA